MKAVTQKQKYFWNMTGSLCNALASMILLIIVNRLVGTIEGGVFALAYSTSYLVVTIGLFEVRPYQSTDIREVFTFRDYFTFRVSTCSIMMLVTFAYIMLSGFSLDKALVVLFVCTYRLIDAFADVFSGLFQQKERIDLSGKELTYRFVFSTIVFILVLVMTKNLVLSCLFLVISSLFVFVMYDLRMVKLFSKVEISFNKIKLKKLLLECYPLFIASFITIFVYNAPKYAIDYFYNDEMQNYYNILFMPAFVVNMLSLFVLRPLLTEFAKLWNDNKIVEFVKLITINLGIIAALTIIVELGSYLVGIPILSILYNLDLQEYKFDLLIIMLGGGLGAFSTFLYYVITVMRKQRLLLIGYFLSFIISIIMSPLLVNRYRILGASLSYAVSLLILVLVFLFILIGLIIEKKDDLNYSKKEDVKNNDI